MFPSRTEAKRISQDLKVLNKLGLHARPAAEFVRAVRTFRSQVTIVARGKQYDAGRLMEVLMANLDQDATFTLIVEGTDADKALARLEKLLADFREAEERGEIS